jgi:hypothetical protein
MFRWLSVLFIFSFFHCHANTQNSETRREQQFENEYVKVWKTIIMPNQPLKMHRHDRLRVVVGLKGGTLTKIEETGETSDLVIETGKAYWFDKDPPNTLHADLNESDEPIEVMLIEFKIPNIAPSP